MGRVAFNPSYIGPRPDIEKLVPPDARMVLDVGCSVGALGAAIKIRTGARVFGIELSEEMAEEAAGHLDQVFVGDATEIISRGLLEDFRFDTIVFADVLEHLVDPWGTLRAAITRLNPGGVIVASIPNIRHMDTLYNLAVRGYWPYRDRGIHDRTHLRFFTRKNVVELFTGAGLKIETMETNYRIFERPHTANRFAKYFALPGLRNFLAFQYCLRAHLPSS